MTKQKFLLAGDIVIEIKENKTIGTNSLINYVFNTAFLDNQYLFPHEASFEFLSANCHH